MKFCGNLLSFVSIFCVYQVKSNNKLHQVEQESVWDHLKD